MTQCNTDKSFYLRGGMLSTIDGPKHRDMVVIDGKIVGMPTNYANIYNLPELDITGLTVLPGFIDVHTHGADGVDVNAADTEGLRKIGRFFASQGVTGWLCSVLTDTPEQTRWCMQQARSLIEDPEYDGAALLGIHLEGPCLASEFKGAMPEHLLMHQADFDLFQSYQEESGGNVRYITLAPEVPGVKDMIPKLTSIGITCAIGHSGAGYDEAMECVAAGARAATHLGNAMRLFHQHNPAIFGVALETDLFVEAICDGRHLHPGTVRLYLKDKGWDRVVAITDSIMAAGLPDGAYKLGVNDVVVEDGDAKLADTGVRAGSTLTMAQAIRNIMHFADVDVYTASRLLTQNPATLIGLPTKGRIAVGCDADLVLLDEAQEVVRTIVGGRSVFERA